MITHSAKETERTERTVEVGVGGDREVGGWLGGVGGGQHVKNGG